MDDLMFKVPNGQNPYSAIGKYIRDNTTTIEDMIAIIEIDGITRNELFLVDMYEDGYFVWESDWWEGEKDIALIDFFPVSDVQKLSVQPEPCEDAVSRKAVKDGFVEMCSLICPYTEKQRHIMCGSCLLGTAFDVLEATQPVIPKQRTGHWIPVGMVEAVGGESAQWGSAVAYHKCSECDEQALKDDFEHEVLSDFCPHCGAKMEGVSE